jgi:prolyl oligopeptidase
MKMKFAEDADPYLWLEDLDDPRVREWASEKHNRALRELGPISEKLNPRIEKYYSIPLVIAVEASARGVFVLAREEGAYKIKLLAWDGGVREIVDSRDLGEDVLIKAIFADKGGGRFAISYSFGGSDKGFTDIIDTASGKVLDRLEDMVVYYIVWLGDDEYYYVRFYREGATPDGVSAPASRVFLRKGGEEAMVFGEGIETSYLISLKGSGDGAKAMLGVSYGWSRSSIHAGDLRRPEGWRNIYGGGDFRAFPIDFIDGDYLVTSYDGEGFGRIVAVSEDGEARELLGDREYPLFESAVAGDRIVANYLVDASSTLKTFGLDGAELDEFKFEAAGSVDYISTAGDGCVFRYQSFMIPHRVYSLREGRLTVLASEEVRGDFQVEEGWANSRDGTKIHSFNVRRRGSRPDKAFVFGYGGFSIPLTPRFFPFVIPFIEDGGTYVQANLRGGAEYGEGWHRAGMRERKQNVFDDYASVIKDLKERGLRVVAFGRSNGGLLVGTAMTQRPELLDGAVIGYPVLDMRRFHKLYVGKAWVPEYGDPDNPEDAAFLAKYSPYHHISGDREYPPIFMYTGVHDDRVHPGHALKFAARLEEAGHDYLLRVEEKSGHAGATPKIKIDEESDIMAFVYKTLGLA